MAKSEQEFREESKSRNRRAMELLRTACEVREGSIREGGALMLDGRDTKVVEFSLTKNTGLSTSLFIDGQWYIRALDAATMDGRDRNRMLAVAKVVANNA